MDAGWRALVRAFAPHLAARAEAVAARIAERTLREVPGYSDVPADDLTAATLDTIGAVVRAFGEGRMPEPADMPFDVEVVRRREEQGVRVQDWIAHGGIFVPVVRDELLAYVREHHGATDDLLAVLSEWTAASHEALAWAGTEFERAAAEHLARDAEERSAFLARALTGALSSAALRSGAAALGLDAGRAHAAVRLRPEPEALAEALEMRRRAQPTVGSRALWGVVDGDLCGVVPGDPPPAAEGPPGGIGPAVALDGLPASFAAATEALETAVRFGLAGSHRLVDLGALPVILHGGRAGDELVARLVLNVRDCGPLGPALVDTVRTYLEHDRRAGPTAAALHLHPNGLRKRLARYEALAGVDLERTDDLVAVWWALRSDAAARR